jgi:hypothetical protein
MHLADHNFRKSAVDCFWATFGECGAGNIEQRGSG